MHAHERTIDPALVRRLLAEQFPQWADLSLMPVASAGTVNAIFRLGEEMAVRLPRIEWGIGDVDKEHEWLPRLAPSLPLAIPVPLAKGKPGAGYPWQWSIYPWLPGEDAVTAPDIDLDRTATDLARFILALQQVRHMEGRPPGRGARLTERDLRTRQAIAALRGTDIDLPAVTEMWEACLHTPSWDRGPVWTHGDLIPTNLLIEDGRLSGIIDFGDLGVGDPACDLVPAWSFLTRQTRLRFHDTLGYGDATWRHGRGWALSQALIILPYYWDTNPVLVSIARRIVAELLAD